MADVSSLNLEKEMEHDHILVSWVTYWKMVISQSETVQLPEDLSHFDNLPVRRWPAESAGTPNSRHHDLGLSISGIFRWGFWGEIQETIGYQSFETLNLVDLPSGKFT